MTDCSICLESMDATDTNSQKTLVCNHVFHTRCIDQWVTQKNECPICRMKINVSDEHLEAQIEDVVTNTNPPVSPLSNAKHFRRLIYINSLYILIHSFINFEDDSFFSLFYALFTSLVSIKKSPEFFILMILFWYTLVVNYPDECFEYVDIWCVEQFSFLSCVLVQFYLVTKY